MKTKNRVYVNSTSSISCVGKDNEQLFQNIINGKTGIKTDDSFFKEELPAIGQAFTLESFYEQLIIQCQYILDNSDLDSFRDTLLVVGSSVGGMNRTEEIFFRTKSYYEVNPRLHDINAIAYSIKEKFDFYDDISFSTACTSSANALGYAYEVLSKGIYKNALVIGADALTHTTVGGFLSLGVLSSKACRPFDTQRDGMNVSEAISCLLLQTEANDNSIEVCGAGYSSDAYHMTHPNPNGEGAQTAMMNALKDAAIVPEQIDYINAHGTGTIANDNAEAEAISKLFPNKPPVSSTKSITGHTLGASGALEAVISCMAIQKQTIPPNNYLDEPENKSVNFARTSMKKKIDYVLSNSFAFGGNNCTLVFGRVK